MIFDKKRDAVFIVCFLLNFFALVFLFIFKNHLPPEIPLFYGRPTGEDQLAKSSYIILPLMVSIVLISFNFFANQRLKNKFLDSILKGSCVIVSLLSVITVIKIFFLIARI